MARPMPAMANFKAMNADARRCDAFNTRVAEYLSLPCADERVWAAFEDFRICYYTYAPDFIPPLTDKMSSSLASYYLFRQKLHALLEAGSRVCAAEARAMWAAHEICYEQFLRSRGRDTVAWLGTFSAGLQDATRAHMLQLVERDYPDTHQLAAACVCGDSGVVAVADEFWEALPLGHMSDEEFRTIEREIVALYALNQKDGRERHGALAMTMDAAQPPKPAVEPEPVAAKPLSAVVGAVDATPPAKTSEVSTACRPLRVALQPAILPRSRGRSRGSEARLSHGYMRSRGKRPRPRRQRRSRSRRQRSRRSRSSHSSIACRPRPRHSGTENSAMTLRPRSRGRHSRHH